MFKGLWDEEGQIMADFDGATTNYNLTSTSNSWVLYFTYHYNSHSVVATLGASASGGSSSGGIDAITIIILILIVAAIVAVRAAILYLPRKKGP